MQTPPDPASLAAEHLGLVHHIARRLHLGHEEDAIGEGNVALMRAAHKFDPARGFAFSTYAGRAIRNALLDYMAAGARSLPVTSHQARKERTAWNVAAGQLTEAEEWGTTDDIRAAHAALDRAEWRPSVRSLDEPAGESLESEALTLADVLADEQYGDPAEWVTAYETAKEQGDMATILNEDLTTWSRAARYPWAEWLDGQCRLLVQGEDFTTSPAAVQNAARQAAHVRGIRVHAFLGETAGTVKLQAVLEDEGRAAA